MAEEHSTMMNGPLQSKSEKPYNQEQCPRCDSYNTKFCYYNNYSLSQPRFFCKGCRRYWTRGGTLRNVPIGGGCRKGKRSNTKPSSSASTEVSMLSPPKISNPSVPSNHQSLLFQPMLGSRFGSMPESSGCNNKIGGGYTHLNLLRGLEFYPSYSSLGRTHHHHQHQDMILETSDFCPTDHRRGLSSRAMTYDWNQNINSSTIPVYDDGVFWTANQSAAAGSSLDPSTTHWPHGLQ